MLYVPLCLLFLFLSKDFWFAWCETEEANHLSSDVLHGNEYCFAWLAILRSRCCIISGRDCNCSLVFCGDKYSIWLLIGKIDVEIPLVVLDNRHCIFNFASPHLHLAVWRQCEESKLGAGEYPTIVLSLILSSESSYRNNQIQKFKVLVWDFVGSNWLALTPLLLSESVFSHKCRDPEC